MTQTKIKTLIEIDRDVWSLTKAFATSKGFNISEALKDLLSETLKIKGYTVPSQSLEYSGDDTSCK